jgi:hypothetical protein
MTALLVTNLQICMECLTFLNQEQKGRILNGRIVSLGPLGQIWDRSTGFNIKYMNSALHSPPKDKEMVSRREKARDLEILSYLAFFCWISKIDDSSRIRHLFFKRKVISSFGLQSDLVVSV